MVPLEGLLPHLGPPDDAAQAALADAKKKLAAAVRQIGTINLTQAAENKVGPVSHSPVRRLP